ncbi:MAG: hypothetical protein ACFCUT_21140 [Kiloniellaceae bacterium]
MTTILSLELPEAGERFLAGSDWIAGPGYPGLGVEADPRTVQQQLHLPGAPRHAVSHGVVEKQM